MDPLEQELFEANKQTYQENVRLTEAQQKEVERIVESKVGGFAEAVAHQKAQMDFMKGMSDPSKPNYKEMCELGAQVVDESPALKAGLIKTENKADFLYDVGVREHAYQASLQSQQAPQGQPAPLAPTPQHTSSPYSGGVNPENVPWATLSDDQFIKYASELGMQF